MLKLSLTIFAILIFNGCSWCEKRVEVPVYVKVPMKCSVPVVECSAKGKNDIELLIELLGCISTLREAAKTCQ